MFWSYQTQDSIHISYPSIGSDGTIYIGTWSGKSLYAISNKGHLKWEFKTGGQILCTPVVGSNGIIYFTSRDKIFYAVNPEGILEWSLRMPGDSTPVIGNNGNIYLGNGSKYISAINSIGEILWDTRVLSVDDGARLSMLKNGIILVPNRNGVLSAVKTSSTGIAESPWPMFGQNQKRTGQAGFGNLVIRTHPSSSTVGNGGKLIFNFIADGSFPRNYQWEYNSSEIKGATQPSLTINNANSKDSGLYRVVIGNKYGKVISVEAVLKVVCPGAPQIFADGKEVVGSVV